MTCAKLYASVDAPFSFDTGFCSMPANSAGLEALSAPEQFMRETFGAGTTLA